MIEKIHVTKTHTARDNKRPGKVCQPASETRTSIDSAY